MTKVIKINHLINHIILAYRILFNLTTAIFNAIKTSSHLVRY